MRNILIVASTILLGSCRLVQPPAEASVTVVEGIYDNPPKKYDYLIDGQLDKNGAFRYITDLRDYSQYIKLYSDYLAQKHDVVTEISETECVFEPTSELIRIPDLVLRSGDKDIVIEQLTAHIQLVNTIVASHNKNVALRTKRFKELCKVE